MNKEPNAASASGDDLLTPCGRIPGSPLPRADYEMVALALAYGKKAPEACRMAGALDPTKSNFAHNARKLIQRPDIRERRDEFLRRRIREAECRLLNEETN